MRNFKRCNSYYFPLINILNISISNLQVGDLKYRFWVVINKNVVWTSRELNLLLLLDNYYHVAISIRFSENMLACLKHLY